MKIAAGVVAAFAAPSHVAVLILTTWMWTATGFVGAFGADPGGASLQGKQADVDPDEALRMLLEGNRRFAEDKSQRPHQTKQWRDGLEAEQHPFAIVLGCSDSRVPPEIIFDQGCGDLFVIRVAGNVVDVDVIASIEYAVDHLATRLLVVMGHSKCGAVTAALDHLDDPSGEPAEVVSLLYRIEPAVVGLPAGASKEQRLDEAVKRNVELAVRKLSRVPDLRRSLQAGKLKIVGALYDMHTGEVKMIP